MVNADGLLSKGARWTEQAVLLLVACLLAVALYIVYLQLGRAESQPQGRIDNFVFATATSPNIQPEGIAKLFRESKIPDGRLSLYPNGSYWMHLVGANPNVGAALTIEQPLLRPTQARYWRVISDPTGTGAKDAFHLIPIPYRLVRSGVALELGHVDSERIEVLAQIDSNTVVRPKASVWLSGNFDYASLSFERGGGALAGAILALALFSAVIGALNRDRTFWLFAGWLIASFRVAAVNGGWDAYWLGADISSGLVHDINRVTLALYALLTVEMLRSVFSREFGSRSQLILVGLRNFFLFLVLMAALLPPSIFLPILWTSGAIGIFLGLGLLVLNVPVTKSTVASLYLLSWAVAFAGILAEVASASGVISFRSAILNAQVGAVASALLTAIALAERLRVERSRRLAAQTQAVGALRQFRDNYNTLPIGLFSLDRSGSFTGYNPAFAAMLGLPAFSAAHERMTWSGFFGLEALEDMEFALRGGRASDLELYRPGANGEGRWYLVSASRKGEGVEGSIQDVTSRKGAEHRLQHLADHDPLTDLLNRRGLSREISVALDHVEDDIPCALVFFDLDRFKLVNDLFGHFAGDQVLVQIAQRLRATFPAPHILGRLGGDEFVVVLKDCTPVAARLMCEEALREIVDRPYHVADKAFAVTSSVGVVGLQHEMSERDALSACDRACAEAKSQGGSTIIVYTADDAAMKEELDEIRLIAVMRQKLPVDRLFTVMQPIISLSAPFANLNYEVLLRMRETDGSVIMPGRFIAAAERNGLMGNIDRWVLNTVLQWLEQHPEHRNRLNFAAINLSGASLNDERFVQDAMAAIRNYPRSAARVCFEITESVALYDLKNTRRFVDRVRSFGSMVALDDFGAGYTSFNYLKELPADLVKIDGTFIRQIHDHPANYAITRAIVDLSHQIGMSVVAEWVETPAVLEALMGLGVDYGQGFALARPLSTETLVPARSSGVLVEDPEVIALLKDRRPPIFQRPSVRKSNDNQPRES